MDLAIEKAKTAGIGWVSTRGNITQSLSLDMSKSKYISYK